MEESKVKTAELYAASDSEKQSLIDWYKDHSHVELHDDGINTIVKICPPEEYGEDEDCESLQNVMRVMFYRLTQLEARNKELEEALRLFISTGFNSILSGQTTLSNYSVGYNACLKECKEIAEQALNKK